MIDDLGTRIKEYYEDRTKTYLTRRTHTVLRLDGRSFSSYTSKLNKPFDDDFLEDMDETAKYLCAQVQGAKFGFTQSDEISLVLTVLEEIRCLIFLWLAALPVARRLKRRENSRPAG